MVRIESENDTSGIIDVLDRVLDKGIVIDAYVRVSVVGLELVGVDARVVVASVVTYLQYADFIATTPTASRPQLGRARATDSNGSEPLNV